MRGLRRIQLLLAACLFGLAGCGPGPHRAPNVVLIVIDTVRADRLSCYGYDRPTTPRIDRLSERGIRFENVASTSSWTLPAHASLFTGLPPIRHGATQEHTRLDEVAATLAELLGAGGYATFGASANPVVSKRSGLARGFESFVETWRMNRQPRMSPRAQHPNLLAVRQFLRGLEPDRRFFLFVNYIEPHGPYQPPEPHRSRFLAQGFSPSSLAAALERRMPEYYLDPSSVSADELAVLNDLYDGEIAYVDQLVGELVDHIEETGRLDETLLVVTSDHGEHLGDHGHFRHVFSLYNSAVRVPLIALLPGGGRAGEVREEPVSLADLFVTILAQAGVGAPPSQREGRDVLAEPGEAGATPLFAEYYYPLQVLTLFPKRGATIHPAALRPYLRRLRSVELDGMRLIWSSDGRHELFDLRSDPHELRNLAANRAAAAHRERLHGLLRDYVDRGGGPRPLPQDEKLAPLSGAFGDLDPETLEQLRELGYLR
jgi:arylsulfatase A-like enzyme